MTDTSGGVMTTDPTPSPADAALAAMHAMFHDPEDGGWPGHDTLTERCHDCRLAAETVLAAVSPVIRRQERAAAAEEIARAIGEECRVKLIDIPGMHMSAPTPPTLTARHTRDIVAAQAAAIARTHAHPEEGK